MIDNIFKVEMKFLTYNSYAKFTIFAMKIFINAMCDTFFSEK